jgi:two-component system response regulator VanR
MNLDLLVYSEETYIATMLKHSTLLQKFSIDTVYGKENIDTTLRTKNVALVIVHIVDDSSDRTNVFEMCQWLHSEYGTPYLVIAESMTECEKLSYLRAGALDCISEECRMEELTIRIQNVLRMWEAVERQINKPTNRNFLQFSESLQINKQYQYVIRGSEQIYLSPIEFRLLCYLVDHQNEIVDSEQLLKVGWGRSTQVGRDELYVYIRSLRKKLDMQGQGKKSCIRSFYGKGYLFQYPESDSIVSDPIDTDLIPVREEVLQEPVLSIG